MKQNIYLNTSGVLQRKDYSLYFENDNSRKPIPIETVDAIYAFGSIQVNSNTLELLAKHNVPVHFFNYYGNYTGTFYPREQYLAGVIIVRQVEHYLDAEKRLYLARQFVSGAISNLRKNVEETAAYDQAVREIQECDTIQRLMGVEGRLRNHYYSQIDAKAPEAFNIGNRDKHPPGNRANALISFGNGLCYAMILNEIYNKQLNPTISYLHEPAERRFSLALDISEVFKPFMVDRLIFRLVNLKMIQPKHFHQEFEGTFLSEAGRKVFLTEWDERLGQTIYHRQLKKQVSYRNLVRLECLKLVKHLLGEKAYSPFRMWW